MRKKNQIYVPYKNRSHINSGSFMSINIFLTLPLLISGHHEIYLKSFKNTNIEFWEFYFKNWDKKFEEIIISKFTKILK